MRRENDHFELTLRVLPVSLKEFRHNRFQILPRVLNESRLKVGHSSAQSLDPVRPSDQVIVSKLFTIRCGVYIRRWRWPALAHHDPLVVLFRGFIWPRPGHSRLGCHTRDRVRDNSVIRASGGFRIMICSKRETLEIVIILRHQKET